VSKSTISTFQLFEMFPDQESARKYLESRLWPEGPRCPVCGLGERITARKGGFYRCNQCKEDFTVRTGTIFERSHVPLHKWIYAMYLLVTARKGISSMQLAKQIGITQKSAWFVLHRLEAPHDGATGELRRERSGQAPHLQSTDPLREEPCYRDTRPGNSLVDTKGTSSKDRRRANRVWCRCGIEAGEN
jgi:transposase-like protein